ncbi:MAG: hypothetical protein IKI57_04680 [Clostridia bacterium]|nr:hypothetical protein [Clostridia bacterium]
MISASLFMLIIGLPGSIVIGAVLAFLLYKLLFYVLGALFKGGAFVVSGVGMCCKNVLKWIAIAICVAVFISMFF